MLYGALSVVAASGTVMVQSVDTAGDASVVVLAGASDAAGATVRFSSRAARDASLVAGASVNLVAISTGYLLVASGKVLAFFPNEIGKALNMFAYETRILAPGIIAQARIAAMLASSTPQRLHDARYNMLAFPYALAYQNSNQWVLETYAAAMSDLPVEDRAQAQAWRSTTSRSSAAWPARSTR